MKIFIALLISVFQVPYALACASFPQSLKLSGSTFDSLPVEVRSSGEIRFDGDAIVYNLKKKKWCIHPGGDASKANCELMNENERVELSDSKTQKILGIAVPNNSDGTLLFMSVDANGKIDRSKPYLRIKNSSKLGNKDNVVNTDTQIEAYADGKVIGTTSSKDSMYMDENGQLRSMYRGGGFGKAPEVVDLRNKKITADGCGGARVESFAGGGGTTQPRFTINGEEAGDGAAGR